MLKKFVERLKELKYRGEIMLGYRQENSGVTAGREMGKQEDREEGIQEGRKQTQIETAKAMLTEGIPVETVQKCTKLSLSKIDQIMTDL